MALALYRKYRPRTFAEVIGQEHVTEPLSQALRSGRLHHAYLFSGPRGCGKTSSARILARSLNCEQGPTPEPCGHCASCRSLANDGAGSIDVIEIDAASHGGVDDARDLREKAFFAPASSRYKIYVIDEAHMVSSAGFNALLKLVEEPPEYVKFIFATTEPEKVLGTIRSRTHHYPFRLIPPATLRPYLAQLCEAEGVHVDPAVYPLVVRAGGGSARDSLSVLDQLIAGSGPEGVSYPRAVALLGVTDVALIDEMCDALAAGDGAAAYGTIDRVAEAGHDPRRFASDLLERLRDLMVMQQVPDAVEKGLIDGPADQLERMTGQVARLGPATLSRCADIVHNGLVEMRGTTAPRLLLELVTARMLLPGAEDSTGALLQRLERMERRLALGAGAAGSEPTDIDPGVRATPATSHPAAPAPAPAPAAEPAAAAAAAAQSAPTGPPNAVQGSHPASSARPGATHGPGIRPAAGPAAPGDSAGGAGRADGPGNARVAGVGAAPSSDNAAARTAPTADSAAAPAGSTAPASPSPTESSGRDGTAGEARQGAGHPGSAHPGSAHPGSAHPGSAHPGSAHWESARSGVAEPVGARPSADAVMPDAPLDLAATPAGPAPGQLSAAAIRDTWPEVVTMVGRKSKKVAALAQGATVRDLDGQTVVLIFRFPAHARMVAAQPELLSDALYEILGGRWQIRCEVAGEGGGSPATSGPAPKPAPTAAPTVRQRDAAPPPGDVTVHTAVAPTPTGVPGSGPASTATGSAFGTFEAPGPVAVATADDDWPEPAWPGGFAPNPEGSSAGGVGAELASGGGMAGHGWSTTRSDAPGVTAAAAAGAPGETAPAVRVPVIGVSGPAAPAVGVPAASGLVVGSSAVGSSAVAGPAVAGPAGADPAFGGRSAAAPGRSTAPSAGLAAARAAAAGGGVRGAGAKASAAGPAAWSDGSPAEEPPYDPDYDGPVGGTKARVYEGFDPGDEPLDDVIDEKTARQSSEQQAMQLLQEAFGAEKIGEA